MYQDRQYKSLRQKLRKNVPDAERKLWQILRKSQMFDLKFIRQYGVGKYVVDFYCPALRLVIESDGGQHLDPENLVYDEARTEFLNSLDIKVIRFYDNEVMNNLDGVVESIIQTIKNINTNSSL